MAVTDVVATKVWETVLGDVQVKELLPKAVRVVETAAFEQKFVSPTTVMGAVPFCTKSEAEAMSWVVLVVYPTVLIRYRVVSVATWFPTEPYVAWACF